MTANILYLLLPFSIAWFGVLLRQAFEMEKERRFRRMWGTIAWSLIPFGVSALVWVSQGDVPMLVRSILLGTLGAAIGASLMIWLGFVVFPMSAQKAPSAAEVLAALKPMPSLPVPTAEEQQRQRRQQLLKERGELELAARDAAGTPVRIEFGQSSTENLHIKDGDTEYQLPVSISNAMGAFVFSGSGSAKTVYVSRSAQHGRPVDIRQIRPSKGGASISIGQHAFVELTDGKIMQLIVTSVQWYNEGDDLDEIRFKYKIYDAGEFLIDAL